MKSLQHINPVVAEELSLPVNTVTAFNNWFWEQGVRKHLSAARHRSIYIPNLGTVTTSRYKLNQFIQQQIDFIRNIKKSTRFTGKTKELIIEDRKKQLASLCKLRNEIAHAYVQAYGVKVRLRKLTMEDYHKEQS